MENAVWIMVQIGFGIMGLAGILFLVWLTSLFDQREDRIVKDPIDLDENAPAPETKTGPPQPPEEPPPSRLQELEDRVQRLEERLTKHVRDRWEHGDRMVGG